jgi:pimeloyl-ACP methyl ester carboxylesterase
VSRTSLAHTECHKGIEAMETRKPHIRSVGQGPTVVLLHSSGSSGRQWDCLMTALQSRYCLHAVDLHGHGSSPAWTGAQRMRLEDDLALVQPLLASAAPVHVVGHSYGGALALKLAALMPDRIASVAVYEPVLFRLLLDHQQRDRAITEVLIAAQSIRNWFELGHSARAAQRFVDFWSGDGAWMRLPPVPQQLIASRIGSVIGHFNALFSDTLTRAALSRLAMPILCMTGAQTRPAPRRIGELLRSVLPRATHEQVANAGHMEPVTHGPAVAWRIGAFLDAQAVTSREALRRAA